MEVNIPSHELPCLLWGGAEEKVADIGTFLPPDYILKYSVEPTFNLALLFKYIF